MTRITSLSACIVWATVALTLTSGPTGVRAAQIEVRIENLAADGGLFLTPFWVGFHDGGFDTFDLGSPASAGLERLAEDGDIGMLSADFSGHGVDGVITSPGGFAGAPVLDPGETAIGTFDVDPVNQRYFSFASMVIPSNDAFIANDDPLAYALFDANGVYSGPVSFTVLGSNVLDAGTEENTELEAAFLNQTGPNMGTATAGGVVRLHEGFINSAGNPGGTPLILGGTTAAGTTVVPAVADFTQPGAAIARITVVPEPTAIGLLLGGFLMLLWSFRVGSLTKKLPR